MKLAVIASGHPTAEDAAKAAFVAARMRCYAALGHEVVGIIPGAKSEQSALQGYTLKSCPSLEHALREIGRFRPDAVACHAPEPSSFSGRMTSLVSGAYRTIVWIHGYECLFTAFYGYQHGWKLPASLPRDLIRVRRVRGILDRVDGAIYVSEWMKRAARIGVGRARCASHVIPNPVDTELFRPAPKSSSQKLRLISVRSLRKQYGLDLAIRAVSKLDGIELTIIGSGPDREEYESLAMECGSNIRILDATFPPVRLAAMYSDFDAFVAPSRTESQGVAMCEAMSSGLPIIAARVGGIPEFVEDGISGLLVKPGNVPALRNAIVQFRDDRSRMVRFGAKARESIVNKCSSALVIGKELDILSGSVGTGPSGSCDLE